MTGWGSKVKRGIWGIRGYKRNLLSKYSVRMSLYRADGLEADEVLKAA
jgi:hypothetical protein